MAYPAFVHIFPERFDGVASDNPRPGAPHDAERYPVRSSLGVLNWNVLPSPFFARIARALFIASDILGAVIVGACLNAETI